MAADGERSSGVVIVPYAPTAKWWGLLRHFLVVGQYEAGQTGQLEMNQLGDWKPVPTRRAFVILAFPRAAGTIAKPVMAGGVPALYIHMQRGLYDRRLGALPASRHTPCTRRRAMQSMATQHCLCPNAAYISDVIM